MDRHGETLISLDFSEKEWKSLKSNYMEMGLFMKCCGAQSIPKNSKLGTQFFAHKAGTCGESEESAEHLKCKELVVKGARSAGWNAMPEARGNDKEGNLWVADVLCKNGDIQLAVEIQLSSQTFDDYKLRTERYRNSNVNCLWLIRKVRKSNIFEQMILDRIGSNSRKDIIGKYPDRKDMPVFQVDVSNANNVFVHFPWRYGEGPYKIFLDIFIKGCLSGCLAFQDSTWRWIDKYKAT
jgi:hypothetical protein